MKPTWKACLWCGIAVLTRRTLCAACAQHFWIVMLIIAFAVFGLAVATIDHLVRRFM